VATQWYPTATPVLPYSDLFHVIGNSVGSFGAFILSLPFGVAVAIYLAEIANFKTRQFLKPVIELLAGIPSVV
jgi:phosphate transport system permease protein